MTWRPRDRRWQAAWSIGAGKRKYAYAKTREAAEAILERHTDERTPAIDPSGQPAQVDQSRRQITARVRFLVLERDGFRCRYCGATPDDGARLVVDHVLPVVAGGTSDMDNLVAACYVCNAGKAGHPLRDPAERPSDAAPRTEDH